MLRPDKNRTDLAAKRNQLLKRLASQGTITQPALTAALAEPLPGEPHPIPQRAPHLLAWVAQGQGTGRVRTTIDGTLQDRVREVRRHGDALPGW